MNLRYVFGPVPSRRLGRSLGVDPIPFKTCNWNCVYCQLGRTTPVTGERGDFVPVDAVVGEVRRRTRELGPDGWDWITILGAGEPTLHAGIGDIVRGIRAFAGPVAVLTNGALLHRAEVRESLMAADAVLPSLDAGSQLLYRRLNRPYPFATFFDFIAGMETFARAYRGKLWIQVMLVRGLNDTPDALADLAAVIARIRPDEVHLLLPVRPPAERWVEPSDAAGVMRARRVLGRVARVIPPGGGVFHLGGFDDAATAVEGIVARHPIAEEDLAAVLGERDLAAAQEALEALAAEGRLKLVHRHGRRFWCVGRAVYGETPAPKVLRAAPVERA